MALRRDGIAAIVLLLLVAAAWADSAGVPGEARMFPRLILTLMGALSALMLALSLRRAEAGTPFIEHARNLAVTVALTAGYIALVEPLGYLVASALFIPALALALGLRRPVLLVLTTAGFVAAVHMVFVVIFGRPLPLGFLAY